MPLPSDRVVFLHGWSSSPGHYRESLQPLRQHVQVYAPILPGHGGRKPIPVSGEGVLASLADDVVNRIPSTFRRYALVGHSLGAGVAVQVALRYPERVTSLFLICPIGGDGDNTPVGHVKLVRGTILDSRQRRAHGATGSDWVPVRKLLRHPVFSARVGLSAKRAQLAGALKVLVDRGLPVVVFYADDDTITPPIPEVKGVDYHHGTGGHTWLLRDPNGFGTWLLNNIDQTHTKTRTKESVEG